VLGCIWLLCGGWAKACCSPTCSSAKHIKSNELHAHLSDIRSVWARNLSSTTTSEVVLEVQVKPLNWQHFQFLVKLVLCSITIYHVRRRSSSFDALFTRRKMPIVIVVDLYRFWAVSLPRHQQLQTPNQLIASLQGL
jgi:hypothetical protein